ncbi:glucose 1-dehydrogenase [Burkholderia pseudomallei]|uniref:glucose 1-dehydrogenase n=1 Tax=Burkholderia pseudomallei TaxID=28450 RepID=UPI00018A568E|nr:glucose 1-dehydrogenase [Burkholderia pseudomallei]AIO94799.1 short chain dehydrogenase family protein [Burkholderia pseudomallei 576]EEC35345.1 oxidoreductase, short chain dehydrogenase/reductase family [Burkholderia pseudomallei 576]KGD28342.1 short chain dehydrogenase family protein [Burkholderia pseudomallei]VBT50794.1 3-ketoacyl-ACP reductase [Burkholderia pseudomallei]
MNLQENALQGKTALITGSSKGLGRAIALRFARLGAHVVINYSRDGKAAGEVVAAAQAMGVKALSVRADVSRVEEIDALFQAGLAAFGALDIVVANAGIEKVNVPVVDVTEADFDLLFRVNTKGPYFVLQAAARHVADGGRIINISSSSTARPQPGLGLYGTSKSAPKYLVRVLAQELGPRKVTVNSLLPGPIDGAGIFTGVSDSDPYKQVLLQSVPLGRLATPDDVADVAAFLAGDASFFITGEEILMNGGSSN